MPEWLVERGIGETRMVVIHGGEILEARIRLHGVRPAGSVFHARLASSGHQGRNAIAVGQGQHYLLPRSPPGVTEGAKLKIEITREAIPGSEPWKRPLARVVKPGWQDWRRPVAATIAFPAPTDALEQAGWSDLLEEARSGIIRFDGGELSVHVTPAMTLIDVNGTLAPFELAYAGAKAAARAIRRHSVGGSVGIDFPTLESKEQRMAVGAAIDEILPKPFERTAVNGFGFLQIVRARPYASLFEIASQRAAFEARALLRRAARERGAIRLVAHPRLVTVLEAQRRWRERLSRQVGGRVSLRAEAGLPMSGGYVEPG